MTTPIPTGIRHPWWHRALRVLTGLVILAAAAVLLWQQQAVRDGEMAVAGGWFGLVLSGPIHTVDDTVYFAWTGGPLIGLRNTWECTVALLAGPLCAIGALLLMFTRMPWHRLLIGLGVALGIVVAVNQVRLLMIAASLQQWGMTGYDISHKVVGSVVAIAGFAAGVAVFLKIAAASTGHRRHRAGFTSAGSGMG